MHKKPKVVRIVIGGLGGVGIGADVYYALFAWLIGAKFVSLHWGGVVGKAEETYCLVEEKVDALCEEGDHIVFFGHSWGAVMAAMYADRHTNVIRLMLIGIPGKGTWWCHLAQPFGSFIGRFVPVIGEITPNSAFLAELEQILIRVADRTICVKISFDLFVLPASSCHIPGALGYMHLRIPLVNHVNVVVHPKVIARARLLIEEAEHIFDGMVERLIAEAEHLIASEPEPEPELIASS